MIFSKFINRSYIRFGHGLFLIDFLDKTFPDKIRRDRLIIEDAYQGDIAARRNIVKDTSKIIIDEILDAEGNLKNEIQDLRSFFDDGDKFIICFEICPIAYLLYGTYQNLSQLPLEEALGKYNYSIAFGSDQNTHYNSRGLTSDLLILLLEKHNILTYDMLKISLAKSIQCSLLDDQSKSKLERAHEDKIKSFEKKKFKMASRSCK